MAAPETIREICRAMADPRVSARLRALARIADKKGGGIEVRLRHPDAVPILIEALADRDRRVQRAAARALRPFVAEDPGLVDVVLPHYAVHTFDGSFTHAGLLDVRDGMIWIPRFAAAKGHAALLADGDTDRFFKFEYFVPGQAPRRVLAGGDAGAAHLVTHFILDWSYSRQRLIGDEEERRRLANRQEQQRYACAVMAFYASCSLDQDVAVHHLLMRSGRPNAYELNVERIEAHPS
jgi:hypothetical protein